MGLPGSGKTTLAKELVKLLPNCQWYNADLVRHTHNDWDFSNEGRIRQAKRLRDLANSVKDYSVTDFVAPTQESRDIFDADYTIWMDTISKSEYEDTNSIFEKPELYNIRIVRKDAKNLASQILNDINNLIITNIKE